MNIFETLIRPDKQDDGAKADIVRAANLPRVGEFRFPRFAYREWHGEELPGRLTEELFDAYMFRGEVPLWASHYVRTIFERERKGRLDDRDKLGARSATREAHADNHPDRDAAEAESSRRYR